MLKSVHRVAHQEKLGISQVLSMLEFLVHEESIHQGRVEEELGVVLWRKEEASSGS